MCLKCVRVAQTAATHPRYTELDPLLTKLFTNFQYLTSKHYTMIYYRSEWPSFFRLKQPFAPVLVFHYLSRPVLTGKSSFVEVSTLRYLTVTLYTSSLGCHMGTQLHQDNSNSKGSTPPSGRHRYCQPHFSAWFIRWVRINLLYTNMKYTIDTMKSWIFLIKVSLTGCLVTNKKLVSGTSLMLALRRSEVQLDTASPLSF